MRCRLIEVSTEESVTAIKATLSLMEPTSGTKDCTRGHLESWYVLVEGHVSAFGKKSLKNKMRKNDNAEIVIATVRRVGNGIVFQSCLRIRSYFPIFVGKNRVGVQLHSGRVRANSGNAHRL